MHNLSVRNDKLTSKYSHVRLSLLDLLLWSLINLYFLFRLLYFVSDCSHASDHPRECMSCATTVAHPTSVNYIHLALFSCLQDLPRLSQASDSFAQTGEIRWMSLKNVNF